MWTQKNNRRQRAAQRDARRSGWLTTLGVGLGAALFGGLLFLSPMCLTPQQVVAQVLRGEKIGTLSVTAETNLSVANNAAFVPTNLLSSDTNQIGLPLAPEITNVVARNVMIGGEKYQMVPFSKLAGFDFKMSDEILSIETGSLVPNGKVLEQIPSDLKILNERAVALTGFMLPVKMNEGLVTDFMLLPNTMTCCFGRVPRINEVIIVNTTGKGFKNMKDIAITIAGTFRVGAIRNDERLIGIYQMDCEQVVEAATLKTP